MRIEEIIDCGPEVKVMLKATRKEMTERHWHWHDEVQFVRAGFVAALLEEAAKRLDESDCGVDWSRACTLKDLADEIKFEEEVDRLAKAASDKRGVKFSQTFHKRR